MFVAVALFLMHIFFGLSIFLTSYLVKLNYRSPHTLL